MLRLLPVLLLALLVLAAPASAAAPRCPNGTVVVGEKKKPRACLPKRAATTPQDLKSLAKLGLKPPRGAKRNKRTEALAARMLGTKVKAAQADDLFGREVSSTQREDGTFTAEYERPDGVDVSVSGKKDAGATIELRDRSGAGHTLGMQTINTVPRCPAANGDVPAKLDQTMTYGVATSSHGKRTWVLVTVRHEATWMGHVGVGAKAETFDLALRGELSIRSGVEIAATGKALKRMPTRTYRTALTKQRLPVGVDVLKLLPEFTIRGPKGTRAAEGDIEAAGQLLGLSAMPIGDIQSELKKGDGRWYEQRACATRDFTWTPEKVVKGGRADWNAWVMAEDGARATAAQWSIGSGCGEPTVTTATGPAAQFGVVDAAGAWEPESTGACVSVDLTSTAGRPQPIHHSIPPLQATRYEYVIHIEFKKDMGAGIAQTNAVGAGRVTVGEGEGYVDGEGTFFGTEWDSGIGNPCGHDMLRTRAFESPVVVGAKIEDGQVTVAFTAIHRLFDASWILTLPLTGGEEFYTSYQPFCGDPQKAFRWSNVKVTGTPVS